MGTGLLHATLLPKGAFFIQSHLLLSSFCMHQPAACVHVVAAAKAQATGQGTQKTNGDHTLKCNKCRPIKGTYYIINHLVQPISSSVV